MIKATLRVTFGKILIFRRVCPVVIGLVAFLILGCNVSKTMETYFSKSSEQTTSYPLYISGFNSKDYTPELKKDTDSYLSEDFKFRVHYYLAQFSKTDDPLVHKDIREIFRQIGKPAVPLLLDALQKKDVITRREIVKILGEMEYPETVDGLLPCLHDPEPEIRAAAITSIEAIRSQIANDEIIKMLTDSNFLVRVAAARATGNLKITSAIGKLRSLLQDVAPEVRGAAAMSLGMLHSKGSIESIKPLLNDTSRDVRQRAIQALRSLGVEGLEEVALADPTNPDPNAVDGEKKEGDPNDPNAQNVAPPGYPYPSAPYPIDVAPIDEKDIKVNFKRIY